MSLLIQNGLVVGADSSVITDIRIEGGKITSISPNLNHADSEKIIDATGKLIFPGGIDPHVHMQLNVGGHVSADSFRSGSIAALHGGTTTTIDFVTPERGESLISALKKRDIESRCAFTDYAFHVSPVEWRDGLEEEIQECRRRGIYSFKVYMAYKKTVGLADEEIRKILELIGRNGGMAAVHCETGDEIEVLKDNLFDKGLFGPESHPLSRPPETEWKAVRKIIDMAGKANCDLYLVHISTKESVEIIRDAVKENKRVTAETCPQYLVLDDSLYKNDFEISSKYIMSPPLRKKGDREALWDATQKGIITTIGTDHCPFTSAQKDGGRDDFRMIPNGAGGVEHRMSILFTYGVLEGEFDINRFVALTSTNAAKTFGLYPRKGTIEVGSDADLVIWNPRTRGAITADKHHQATDLNIYEGISTMGAPQYVIKGGVVVIKNGKLSRSLCPGQFLPSSK